MWLPRSAGQLDAPFAGTSHGLTFQSPGHRYHCQPCCHNHLDCDPILNLFHRVVSFNE